MPQPQALRQAWAAGALFLALTASLGAFARMGLDKRRARRGQPRLSERSFAWLSLLGGWPGILAGGAAFRHKTQARGFQAKVVGAALLHAAVVLAIAWWLGRS